MPIGQGDERKGHQRDANGKLIIQNNQPIKNDEVVAAKVDLQIQKNWEHIYSHATGKLKTVEVNQTTETVEEIRSVLVHIYDKVEKKSRWIVYANGDVTGELTVNPGLKSETTDDMIIQNITFVDTGGPNTQYYHFPNCEKICFG